MNSRLFTATLVLCVAPVASNAAGPITVDLWPGGKPPGQTVEPGPDTVTGKGGRIRLTNITRPQIVVYPAPKEKNTGAALIIAPGGGFKDLGWTFEGETMADWCNKRGVTGILLKYRVPGQKGNAGAFQDGQRSVGVVRSRAAEWGIDPNKIGMIGFSAGGGVMNYVLLNTDKRGYEPVDEHDKASSRLDWGVLIYAAGGFASKNGQNPAITKDKIPPLFMAVAYNDFTVNNMVQSFMALKKAGVETELHIYATGGHAFGGNLMSPPVPLVGDWSHRLEAWMQYKKLIDLAGASNAKASANERAAAGDPAKAGQPALGKGVGKGGKGGFGGPIKLGPDDKPAFPDPPTGFNGARDNVPHGQLTDVQYDSKTLGTRRKMAVYMPPGYAKDRKYPVLYLLHGLGNNDREWTQRARAPQIVDNLLADKKIQPLLMIFPNGDATATVDNPKGGGRAAAGYGMPFEHDLLKDIIPYVESHYSVLADRDHRALAGMSMGGGQSLNIGLAHVDKFAWVGGVAAAPNTKPPAKLLPDPAMAKKLKLLWLGCGSKDGLIRVSQGVHNYLKENGVPHVWHVDGNGHDTAEMSNNLYYLIQRLFKE